MKTLTNCADLTESRSRMLLRLTDIAVRALAGFFSKPLVYCKLGFRKPLRKSTGGFQEAGHDREYTFILISGLTKGFSH